jgi:DNA polymerase-3 subunit gamma/tau
MQNFVVSARKYRPATFETVVGQSHITGTLKNAILTEHLAQAFLFCGPRGVGKTTCARILAKTINCENLKPEGEACGECKSCLSYQNSNSFNIHELDAASNNSVDDIRNLNEQVRIPPQFGKYKVYIIDEVHMLSTAAFNAFLKTLEEPPRYAIFILATTEKHKILPTILSRCQIFDFNRIKISDISGQLAKVAQSEGIAYEEEGLRVIAAKADGGMRDALSMFDMVSTFSQDRSITYAQVINNLHILDSDYYFKITQAILNGNGADLLLIFDQILQKGFDGHLFILGLAEHFRDLILATDPATHVLLELSEGLSIQFMEQASKASTGIYLNLLNLASQTELQYKNSKNARLLVELCLLKMANLRQALSSEVEKKKSELNQASGTLSFKTPEPVAQVKDKFKLERASFKEVPSIKLISEKQTPLPLFPEKKSSNTTNLQPKEKLILSPGNLEQAKESYCQWLKNEQIQQVSAWNLASREEIDGLQIYLSFQNEIAFENFEKERPLILRFFNENFNRCPVFETMVSESEPEIKKPYTNDEKFGFLTKKYPKLAELRVRLGLEAR